MDVVDTIDALRQARQQMKGTVGLVPTMGALHDGHLALVRQAKAENDVVIVSIFVNPTQFNPNEDLSKYPRDIPHDLELLRQEDVDLVFTPTPELIYPEGFQTWVNVEQVSQGLEGERRPGHFRGVTTVVAKLFNLTQPKRAYFGQKDAQQAVVIKRMTRDLNFPIVIRICPTVREPDGLAMSSRNVYLNPEHRAAAAVIRRALLAASSAYENGERNADDIRIVIEHVLETEPLVEVDYISIANAVTLHEIEIQTDDPLLISLVVNMGGTHLLDNILLPAAHNTIDGLTDTLGGA
ncbi:MAG: pantoate--beta-alanine ligase [Anaerolineaceae bacterium]|nr:pantoate--beta-alanine ligase [Anaerolineaceae bacterium]